MGLGEGHLLDGLVSAASTGGGGRGGALMWRSEGHQMLALEFQYSAGVGWGRGRWVKSNGYYYCTAC